jgi:hypothetical protein
VTAELLPDLTSDGYHEDPVPELHPDVPASLNSSTARVLLTRTPAHAKAQHPRLADTPPAPRTSDAMDMGTAVHQLLLRDDRIWVGDYPDFRTRDAREWRDRCRVEGKIPMLQHKWEEASDLADAIRERMLEIEDPRPFTNGTPEATIVWQEQDVWCRARLDWLRDDLTVIDDLKCTSRTADPRVFERQIWSYGYDVQAALYVRGVQALHGIRPRFRWVAVETYAPFAVSVLELNDEAMFAAQVKVDEALRIWRECLTKNEWPAYPLESHIVYQPGWVLRANDQWGAVDVDETVPF